MLRSLTLILSLLSSFTLLGATAWAAPGNFYSATPATAPAVGKSVVRNLIWNCDGQACVAAQGNSRPAIVCATVARELGALTAFRAGEESFDADALARCNARAG